MVDSVTLKLSGVDAETLRDTLGAVLAVSTSTEGMGLRFATLCGFSTVTEKDYIEHISRLVGYVATVCKTGGDA